MLTTFSCGLAFVLLFWYWCRERLSTPGAADRHRPGARVPVRVVPLRERLRRRALPRSHRRCVPAARSRPSRARRRRRVRGDCSETDRGPRSSSAWLPSFSTVGSVVTRRPGRLALPPRQDSDAATPGCFSPSAGWRATSYFCFTQFDDAFAFATVQKAPGWDQGAGLAHLVEDRLLRPHPARLTVVLDSPRRAGAAHARLPARLPPRAAAVRLGLRACTRSRSSPSRCSAQATSKAWVAICSAASRCLPRSAIGWPHRTDKRCDARPCSSSALSARRARRACSDAATTSLDRGTESVTANLRFAMNTSLGSLTLFFPMWNEEEMILRTVDAAKETGDDLARAGVRSATTTSSSSTTRRPTQPARSPTSWRRPTLASASCTTRANRRLGGSVRTGLAEATTDLVLYTDADMPFDLADLGKAVRLMRVYDADIVSAYRFDRTGEGARAQRLLARLQLLVKTLFRLRMRDVNFAFKLIRREVLDHLELRERGFVHRRRAARQGAAARATTSSSSASTTSRASAGTSTLSSPAVIVNILRELVASAAIEVWRDPEPLPEHTLRHPMTPAAHRQRRRLRTDRQVCAGPSCAPTARASSRRRRRSRSARPSRVGATLLDDVPDLGVGVHLAVVGEDPPLLSRVGDPDAGRRRRTAAAVVAAVPAARLRRPRRTSPISTASSTRNSMR